MKDIGQKLKKERINRKLTYQDISILTKMPEDKIKAIEDGDLDFFVDDISFLRFYVRSYCKVLEIDYEQYKQDMSETVLDFTSSIDVKKELEKEELEQNIKERSFKNINRKESESNVRKPFQNIAKKRIDTSLISLIVISIVVLGIVGYVGLGILLEKEDTPAEVDPKNTETEVVPQPTPEVDDKEEKEPVETKKITFSEVNQNTYIMESGTTKELEIVITFEGDCYLEMNVNGVRIENVNNYSVVKAASTFTQKITLVEGDVFSFKFGNYPASKPQITVNGDVFEYNYEALATAGPVIQLELQSKGE